MVVLFVSKSLLYNLKIHFYVKFYIILLASFMQFYTYKFYLHNPIMGLEKLEVENFKSYAGTHTIGPFDKFTCVIGPNGSGKSNIMDAIAFALGFSSSSLRTSTAVNCIHNGCTNASVKIFIDQHTFRRHVTTSGKSTYFYDGKLVGFEEYSKGLNELGLDLKLRNFMVFQGDIHEIANKSPKELCEYFEVLSGSIAHKKEYDEVALALNKDLAECAILYEQKKNVLSVMREEKEEKKQMDLFNKNVESKARLEKKILNLEVKELKNKLSEVCGNLENLSYNQEKANLEVQNFEKEVLKKKEEVAKVRNEFSSLEQNLQDLRYKKMNQVREMAAVYKLKDKNNLRRKEVEDLIKENQDKLNDLEKNLEKEKGDLKRLEDLNLNYEYTEEQENEYLRNMEEKRSEMVKIKCEILRRNKSLKDFKKKQKENENKRQKMAVLNRNVDFLKRNIAELYKKMGEDLKKYEDLENQETEMNKKVYEIVSELLKVRASRKINQKKEMTRSVVNTLKGIFPGVHGLLVDLVRPTQKKYYSPVMNILQSYEYAVVVDSDTTALTCISYIKEKKLCKLMFLPLRTLKKKDVELHNEEGYRSALLCVSFEDRYTKAVQMALKDSIIADSKEVAMDLVYGRGFKSNVCSLDNFFIRSKGRIISTFKEQEEREDLFSKLVEERKDLLKKIKVVQDEKSKMSRIEIVKERIKVYEDKIKEDEDKMEEIEEVEFPVEDTQALESELSRIKEELKKEEVKIFGNIFGASSYEENKKGEYEDLKRKIKGKIERMEEEVEEIKSQNEDLLKERKEETVQGLDPELESEIRKYDFLTEKKRVELETVQGVLMGLNEEYKALSAIQKELNSNYLNLEAHRNRLEEEIEEKIRFAMLEEIPIEEEAGEVESLRGELALVNKKINEMVPSIKTGKKELNYNRILQEYEDAKYKAMETRKKMNEVKRERRNLFMACFEVVSSEIGKIYQEISNGETSRGNAYLVLDNPTEPYLDGIRFHVMPPTKRFREIGFLSGGEKSMAILSLMFSINRYRPVPFFILDEFDSALDKTNVGRMVDFFVRSDVQFLIISLKPILFQFADSLIGVYKEMDNVNPSSRILTYRL